MNLSQRELETPRVSQKRVIIGKTFRFEASHVLPKHPGKCSRLHGHSWVLHVSIRGRVDRDTGFVADYAELKRLVQEQLIDKIDHQHLGQGYMDHPTSAHNGRRYNAVLGEDFYPSSENLVIAFANLLEPIVNNLGPPDREIELWEVTLEETCTSKATWRLPSR